LIDTSIRPFVGNISEAKIFSASTPELCRKIMASEYFQSNIVGELEAFAPNESVAMLTASPNNV
jgi:hypothetical protein